MALQKITYENKTALLAQPAVANINKISDTDMNEIKTVVNAICDATDTNTTNITSINTKVTNLENKTTVKAIIDVVYPVGSIYISKDSTNPGTLWPGTTWEREAEGRCIIGIGTGYTTVGATGGSSTVTLGTTQIPSHTHTFTGNALSAHSHTRGTMNITGSVYGDNVSRDMNVTCSGAFSFGAGTGGFSTGYTFNLYNGFNFDASRNWTGSTSSVSGGIPSGTNSSTGGGST